MDNKESIDTLTIYHQSIHQYLNRSCGYKSNFLIKFLRNMNIKIVTSIHNKYKSGLLLKDWYNSFLLKGDSVIFNSNFVKNSYVNKYWLKTINFDPSKKLATGAPLTG